MLCTGVEGLVGGAVTAAVEVEVVLHMSASWLLMKAVMESARTQPLEQVVC